MTPRRFGSLAIAALAFVALLPSGVRAEDPGNDRNTVQVGPNTAGPVVVQGTASYDPNGIPATAASSPAPTATGPVSDGSGNTYRPVPYNAVPITGPVTINSQGVISNPTGPAAGPACPNGGTGYYAYGTQGNSLGIVCVPSPTDFPPATSPEIALAEQASSQQPWPALRLGINPGVGLTGLPSWCSVLFSLSRLCLIGGRDCLGG